MGIWMLWYFLLFLFVFVVRMLFSVIYNCCNRFPVINSFVKNIVWVSKWDSLLFNYSIQLFYKRCLSWICTWFYIRTYIFKLDPSMSEYTAILNFSKLSPKSNPSYKVLCNLKNLKSFINLFPQTWKVCLFFKPNFFFFFWVWACSPRNIELV